MPNITFIYPDGSEKTVDVPIGISLLEAAHKNEVPLEGACEGSLACSTCHIIFEDESIYSSLPEAREEEEDMLDLAFGLTHTSRLGCQIMVTEALDGVRVRLPEATRNMQVEG